MQSAYRQARRRPILDETIYTEVEEKIKQEVPIDESEIQVTLRLARERYKVELTASRDYHKKLAEEFETSGDNQLALRQSAGGDFSVCYQ